MKLVDSHIHLDADDFRPDLQSIVDCAREKKVDVLLVPNVDAATGDRVVEVCSEFSGICYPMMGLHPTSVREDFGDQLAYVERKLVAHDFVAVGEIGIDLYWDKTYFAEQKTAFVRQMELARDMKLPAVIHSRKSLEEIMAVIKANGLMDIPAVFHCFPGSVEQAKRLTGEGYCLGIGGVVTFKNAGMAEVVRKTPLEFILLETDAPWLAPVPHRGKRNEPSYIEIIAAKVAEIKETSVEEVAAVTTANAQRLFPGI